MIIQNDFFKTSSENTQHISDRASTKQEMSRFGFIVQFSKNVFRLAMFEALLQCYIRVPSLVDKEQYSNSRHYITLQTFMFCLRYLFVANMTILHKTLNSQIICMQFI